MPNHCEPAAGSTRTRASPALTCAPTASLNKNSGVGSVPRASRNRANCRSSVGSSAGVKPHRFIDTSSLPSSVTVLPGMVRPVYSEPRPNPGEPTTRGGPSHAPARTTRPRRATALPARPEGRAGAAHRHGAAEPPGDAGGGGGGGDGGGGGGVIGFGGSDRARTSGH